MQRADLSELQYITPLTNLASILEHGILCHRRARHFGHETVAKPEVQERRENKRVPGGRPLHDYANLYICARNPMMYKRRSRHLNLCVLQVSTAVLDLANVVIVDRNASRHWAKFMPSPEGLAMIDKDEVFATYWTDVDPFEHYRKAGIKCAEVLVPDRVAPDLIIGVRVSCSQATRSPELTACRAPITIDEHLFFYRG